jgi:hypothetical protein
VYILLTSLLIFGSLISRMKKQFILSVQMPQEIKQIVLRIQSSDI